MTDAAERLYNLLPSLYRTRDAHRGQPLRALMALIEAELNAIEADVDGLYEDAFIETCAEWVVPYIGDLLAVRGLHAIGGAFSQRAYVANTLAYRRRKGTAAVLEQLARDTTGWPARAVEFFERLIANQHLNHLRPHSLAAPDLRDAAQLELIGGPFERAMHSAELRRIVPARGRYNIPNVGLFLWRLQSYPVALADARPAPGEPAGRYTFSPLGIDGPLFNPGRSESDIVSLASEPDVPGPLRRRPLYAELEARRQAISSGAGEQATLDRSVYFGQQPVFEVKLDLPLLDANAEIPLVPAQRIRICDLSDWHNPTPIPPTPPATAEYQTVTIAADPVLGRLVVAPPPSARVQVSYAYGFSGDVGGGPYDRRDTLERWFDPARSFTWQLGVTKDQRTLLTAPAPGQLVQTLGEALDAWNAHVAAQPGARGLIAVMDSSSYDEALTGADAIVLPAGSVLAIVAADWPLEPDPAAPGAQRRVVGQFAVEGLRPHIRGEIAARGDPPADDSGRGELVLDGLLLDGKLSVLGGDLGALTLAHCTLVPDRGGLEVQSDANGANDALQLSLLRAISGPIRLPEAVPALAIDTSIVDGEPAIIAPGAALGVQASTVYGSVSARTLEAGNSVFTGLVTIERRQSGCARFCFVPDGSRTPRRYRCQPDLALETRAKSLGIDPVGSLPAAERDAILARVMPAFSSRRYGRPDYAQLALAGPDEIATGAEDGSEMGAFGFLKNSLREANLRAVLDEYLRFGLEAGLLYVT